jgi:nitrogen regulatory protein P-II 1
MKEIKAIFQPFLVETVLRALDAMGRLPGLTLFEVRGWGRSHHLRNPALEEYAFTTRTQLEMVVTDEMAPRVVEILAKAAHTGGFGDGKVFVSEVSEVVNIRTGERGPEVLDAQGEDQHGA